MVNDTKGDLPEWRQVKTRGRYNLKSRSTCINNHEWTPENTGIRPGTQGRYCRHCKRDQNTARRTGSGDHNQGKKLTLKSQCIYGHKYTPENTIITKTGRNCAECARTRSRVNKARRRKGLATLKMSQIMEAEGVSAVYEYARIKGLERPDVEDLVKKDSLAYLKLSLEASKASDEINFQVDRTWEKAKKLPLCYGKEGEWTDYPKTQAPSTVTAALMCAGCDIFEQCAKFAELTKPTVGVWAGEVWIIDPKAPNGSKGVKRDK